MPTGYTSKLHDGPQDFRSFALQCARGMGALVLMRDEAWDAPIPDVQEPGDYHAKAAAEARAALADAESWTVEEAGRRAEAAHETERAAWVKRSAESAAIEARYSEMASAVNIWSAPTPEHEGLKRFMLEQLAESERFDCCVWEEPTKKTGAEFQADRIVAAAKDIAYHTEENAKEVRRAAERTRWVSALRGSLPAEPAK